MTSDYDSIIRILREAEVAHNDEDYKALLQKISEWCLDEVAYIEENEEEERLAQEGDDDEEYE